MKHKVQLKSSGMAAVLAFLVPGLGHLYQGRYFKSVVYSVCILGTFILGMRVGDCKVVYFDWAPNQKTLPYLCQVFVGLPALPAIAQSLLRPAADFEPNLLRGPLSGQFAGTFTSEAGEPVSFTGEITLEEIANFPGQLSGQVRGTLHTPQGDIACSGRLERVNLDPRVAPDRERQFVGVFDGRQAGKDEKAISGQLEGGLPRGWLERYDAPLPDRRFSAQPSALEKAHLTLGKNFELGVLYTMVAGLLNILAIYDALEGPAYGDEETERAPSPAPS